MLADFGVLRYHRIFLLHLRTFVIVLTNLGEKLSDAEVDELLKGVEVDKSGKVHYEGNGLIFKSVFTFFD